MSESEVAECDGVESYTSSKTAVWTAIGLVFLSACIGIALVGYAIHVNHSQERVINSDFSEATKTVTVLRVSIDEQFYAVMRSVNGGEIYADHVPRNMIMPKNGPEFEQAHCIVDKSSAMGTIMMMKQFETDFRGVVGENAIMQYDRIEIRFEAPFGYVMDLRTGTGYPGIDNLPEKYDPFTGIENDVVYQRGRCGVPYCPDYGNIYSFSYDSPDGKFAKVPDEYYVFYGGLYERVAVSAGGNANGISDIIEDRLITRRVTCKCTRETPPRMSCSFPASTFLGTHARYRLDIGFKYLLKPIQAHPQYMADGGK